MRLLLPLSLLFLAANSYKILVFCPNFSQSINNFLGNIADILVDAGHDVTTLIPIVHPHNRDGTHKSRKIHVQPTREVEKIGRALNIQAVDFFDYDNFDAWNSIPFARNFIGIVNAQCKGVLDEPGLIEKLKAEKFDAMIVENFEGCGTGLSHLVQPKSLITTAGSVPMGPQSDDFGLERALSYNPNPIIDHLDVHSFSSRLWNIVAQLTFQYTWRTSRSEIEPLFRARYGPQFPSIKEIASHAAFTFINSEPLIDFAAPTLNRVHFIGGIGAQEPKPLDEEWGRLLDERPSNVLISFGSIVMSRELPAAVRANFVETIRRLPEVTFFWKYESPEDAFAQETLAAVKNLHLVKWTPQNDLLADPRLTAFITHGGMASTQEVALRGKPGLFIPFIGDQPRNSGMMEKNGVGKVFLKKDLSNAAKLHSAVKDLLENDSYRKKAEHIAAMIRKKPFSAKEQLIKTVEFAAEFGPAVALRPESYDMNWCEYHNADIVGVFLLLAASLIYLLCRCLSACCRSSSASKSKRD